MPSSNHSIPSATEFADELGPLTAGAGMIALILFPFSLPALALLAIVAVPLLIPGIAVGLAIAAFAVPVLLVRGVVRYRRRSAPAQAQTATGGEEVAAGVANAK